MITKSHRQRVEVSKKKPNPEVLGSNGGPSLNLGGLLESIRLGEELSQAAFAKKLGVSSSHLCDISATSKKAARSSVLSLCEQSTAWRR